MTLKERKDDPNYIKAGYIYNLTKVVHWPQTAFNFSVSPFILSVLGDKALSNALIHTLREKTIKDREWKVEFYNHPQKIRHCHLVFIANIDEERISEAINLLIYKNALLVGDNINKFCKLGGMINLVGTCPNYGYEVNPRKLEQVKLVVNPDFLELATIIEQY
jgi:hypothetical protein